MTLINTEEVMTHRVYFDTEEGKQGFILSERVKFLITAANKAHEEAMAAYTSDLKEQVEGLDGFSIHGKTYTNQISRLEILALLEVNSLDK